MKPLISHEIPSALFPYHDLINNYPYVLAHLLGKNETYTTFYKQKLQEAEYSILDNSAFELGKPIDGKLLLDLALEFQPTHIVVPDELHNLEGTKQLFGKFNQLVNDEKHPYTHTQLDDFKYIGVCQGKNIEEASECFDFFTRKEKIDIIAIPFDLFPDSDNITDRFRFLNHLYYNVFTKTLGNIKIHLLGCKNPVEFQLFKHSPIAPYIHSIDTSSPIVNGFVGNKLNEHGLTQPKPKEKLADNIDRELSTGDITNIIDNVIKFREYVNW